MGTIFEELVRRFNEENSEEAGEHWTPRVAVKLMARLIFLPIADQIESGTYLLYDGACGTGGMLTVAEETLQGLAAAQGKQVATHLYGQEINAETYAIAKADFLLKGEGEAADNLVGGPEHSTLANDAFPGREFDFMLSNPPYGKSWKIEPKIFPNQHFGYWKIAVERPLRLTGIDSTRVYSPKEIKALKAEGRVDPAAPPVIKKLHKPGKADPDPLPGLFEPSANQALLSTVVKYDPDADLRDTEQIPLLEPGGIEAFIRREVLPYAPDAWLDPTATRIGYEISFTRYFYKPQPLRPLDAIRADSLALEHETEGLLTEILGH